MGPIAVIEAHPGYMHPENAVCDIVDRVFVVVGGQGFRRAEAEPAAENQHQHRNEEDAVTHLFIVAPKNRKPEQLAHGSQYTDNIAFHPAVSFLPALLAFAC